MTYATFLAALRKTPRKWRINRCEHILLGHMCPLRAAAGTPGLSFIDAGYALGLDSAKIIEVATAADNTHAEFKRIRRDLLKACGLKERTK